MESSSIAIDFLCRPYLILKHERLRQYYRQHYAKHHSVSWDQSRLNPQNRIDSFDTSRSRWRVDGATAGATQFFIVPIDLLPGLRPLRIDVFISDQLQHPSHLRIDLDLNIGVPIQENRALARLGISRHLCRALDEQCVRDPSFLARYCRLPFGSRLLFTSISPNPRDMELVVLSAFNLEREALSVGSLQRLWPDIPKECWPRAVDLSRLRFIRQLHESITLVQLADDIGGMGEQLVFKSNTESLTHLYHELRFLLRCPPHQNIMPRPARLVTKRSNFGGKVGLFGFLLPYYPQGSIRDDLPRKANEAPLSLKCRLELCMEVTSALIHVRERCGTFYSDLRPENVLLSDSGHAVLCDFEQRGNHYEWCPPEVLPYLYLENLQTIKHETRLRSLEEWPYIKKALSDTAQPPEGHGPSDIKGLSSMNRPWMRLNPSQQEMAMVYSLGLFIYAVFEGLSGPRKSISHRYPVEPDLEFPQMRIAPIEVRDIVHKCTQDGPEWESSGSSWTTKRPGAQAYGLLREGGYILPSKLRDGQEAMDVAVEGTVDVALEWWRAELSWADEALGILEREGGAFDASRPTLRDVLLELQDVDVPDEEDIYTQLP
ncbi:hypothetical protein F5Y05DRAFT_384667 [Hypoxylon sp. FL0543]|nr:hypothetical protein F5Y05DRAFT_384667 [Hypoxylon sp. FL0543]